MNINSVLFKIIIFSLVCFIPGLLFAGDVFWNNAAGGNWSDGANWDSGTAPQPGDDVFITLDGTYTVTLDVNMDVNSLTLGAATGTQTLSANNRTITTIAGFTINANGVLYLGSVNTINGPLNNAGTINVQFSPNTISGALTTQAGSMIDINNFGTAGHSALTVSNGFTNNGTIRLNSTVANNNYTQVLTVSSGTLVNAGGGTIINDGPYGTRTINGSIDNQGTINVTGNRDVTFAPGASGTFLNSSGMLNIDASRTLFVSGGTFEYAGGSITAGTLDFTGTSVVFTQTTLPIQTMKFTNSIIDGPGTLLHSGTIFLRSGNTIVSAFNNAGALNVQFSPNTISGALTTQAGSIIDINNFGTAGHSALTVSNGFTNNGTIQLNSTVANNNYTQVLTVSSGTLVNAGGGTIINDGPYGTRTINAAINNQGTIRATGNRNLTVNSISFDNQASGLIEGDRTIAVIGTALQNSGTIDPGVSGKGALGLSGNLVQPASGALNVDMEGLTPGTDFDQLNVSGATQLNGTLNINRLNAYEPALGDSFTVLTYGSRIDTFQTITGQDIGNGKYFYPNYYSDHLALFVGPPPVTPQFTLTASTGANGSISPSGAVVVFQGDDQTFTMTPIAGYEVADVLVDGVSVGAVSNYTFTNVTADHTIHATFQPQTFTITASAGAGGSISPTGAVPVTGGTDQTFTITPNTGYHVLDVLVDGVSVGALSIYTFGNVNADHTISASFALNVYNISAAAGSGGSITPAGNVPVNHGSSQLFNIVANVNYSIGDLQVDGASLGALSSYEFLNVTAPHSIFAYFTPDNFTPVVLNTGVTVNIHNVYFVNGLTGYAVGEGGTVLITTDGGASWTVGNIGLNIDLTDVVVINNIIYVTGANGHICYSSDGGLTWIPFNLGITNTFHSISFSSGGYGFAVGDNGVLYFWNGTIWVPQNLGVTTNFQGVYTIGNFAYVVGAGGVVWFYNGSVWSQLNLNTTIDLYRVVFLNANFGYIVGAGGTIFHTTDGGTSWVSLNTGVNVIIRDIIIGDLNTAWAVCDGGLILQTTDGGATWEVISVGSSENFLGISFAGGQGYIVGSGGVAYNFQSTVVSGTPQFAVAPASLDFGDVSVGGSISAAVVVSNPGDADLTISSAVSSNGEFSVSPGSAVIPALGSQNFVISFSPASAGAKTGSIDFSHDAAGSPGSVAVSGTAVDAGLIFTARNVGTSQHLRGASFLSSSYGAVVGSGGVCFITSDGGATWTTVNVGVNVDFNAIRFIGSAAFIVGANGHICRSDDGGLTWTPFTTGVTADFLATSFINAFYGFAVGANGTICIYDGTTWTVQTTGVTNTFYGVYAVGGTAYAVGSGGIICRYNGSAWVPQVSGVTIDFFDVAFLDEQFGYAVGAGGTICRTLDGGTTWLPLISGVTVDITGIKIFSPLVAWATCANGLVLQTIDGGVSWTQVPVCTCGDFAAIDFNDCNGIVVGQNGSVYTFSSDQCSSGGLYQPLAAGTSVRLRGVSFIDALNGCVAGNGGTVLVTSDGGVNWTSSYTGVTTDLTGIRLVPNGGNVAGFITGLNGLICRSDDLGLSWTPFTTNTSAHFYASSFINANLGWAVGSGGTICIYDGVNWIPQTTNTTITFYGVYGFGGFAWAVGENGTICRYDGSAWSPQTTNTNVTFYDVAFLNAKFGYAVGADGTICRTRNGGQTWTPLVSGVNVTLRACKILSPRVAYCLGDDGTVLETTDCGDTWTPVNTDFPAELEGIEIVDGQGFVVGDLGEAYSFVKPEIVSYQLFELSSDSLGYGSVTSAAGRPKL
ncbi:MAG: hypothetical protein Kow0042_04240 [Calditrichia bacterium]